MELEHFFTCPYCWQKISMVIDLSIGGDDYVEDCEVCCRPIRIVYRSTPDEVKNFEAFALDE